MDYVKLGRSGLEVSRICLGCMSFGDPETGAHAWTLDEEKARPIVKAAIEGGINFFDTANVYSGGTSERILGKLLNEFTRREEVVVATKVFGRMRPGPNGAGLSRKAILSEVDASLVRLQTDYIDLYQIHRYDAGTPIEETLEALTEVVRSGKVRYIGASSMYAWQFAQMLYMAEREGFARFISMQNHVNLLYREEEREMLPLCQAEGVGILPWSPLARGRLARPADQQTIRSEKDEFARKLVGIRREADAKVIAAVAGVAARSAKSMAEIALAWVLAKAEVAAPIVGATSVDHLTTAIRATEVSLTPGDLGLLESGYEPQPVLGIG